MAKRKVEDVVAEIKKLLDEKKVLLGAETTVKRLREGKIKKVFLSSNCSPAAREEIEKLCKLGNVECVDLKQNNEEIGSMCRKPFSISIIGVTA